MTRDPIELQFYFVLSVTFLWAFGMAVAVL